MIISFSVSNFLSVDDAVKIDFEAAPLRAGRESTITPFSFEWDYALVRSIGILGFNAAGKSNLLRALAFFKYSVLYSVGSPVNLFDELLIPFLLNARTDKATSFQMIFFLNNRKYRYEYGVYKGAVLEESLHVADPGIRENSLFERRLDKVSFNKTWNKSTGNRLDMLAKGFPSHQLLLTFLGVMQVPQAGDILSWFNKIEVVESFQADQYINLTVELLEDDALKLLFNKLLEAADVGFKTVIFKKLPPGAENEKLTRNFLDFMVVSGITSPPKYEVQTRHQVYDEKGVTDKWINFNLLTQESSGTKKFFGLIGLFLDAFKHGKILVIDELDSQFHHAMYVVLVEFFNNPLANQIGAQLLYTSHNTSQLRSQRIRRDQFYTIVKNERGASLLSRFHEKGNTARTDSNLEKIYTERTVKSGLSKIPDLFSDLEGSL